MAYTVLQRLYVIVYVEVVAAQHRSRLLVATISLTVQSCLLISLLILRSPTTNVMSKPSDLVKWGTRSECVSTPKFILTRANVT